jgi:hypothetical protein
MKCQTPDCENEATKPRAITSYVNDVPVQTTVQLCSGCEMKLFGSRESGVIAGESKLAAALRKRPKQ